MNAATTAMTYAPDTDLPQWLASRIREGCNRFTLRHRAEDGSGHQRVRDWPIAPGVNSTDLAQAIQQRAWEEGRHFGARCIYGVFAYRDQQYVDRRFFTIEGDAEEDGPGFAAPRLAAVHDVATEQLGAVTSQLMRHNEANIRLAIGQTVDVIGHYKTLLDARDRRIHDLEKRLDEQVSLYQRLTLMEHERELDVMREQREDRKGEFLREKLDLAVPVLFSKIASHISGGGAGSGSGGAENGNAEAGKGTGQSILREEVLTQFLGSLKKEQTAKIMAALEPEQQIAIQELYVTYGKRAVAKQAAKDAKAKVAKRARKRHPSVGTPEEGQ